MIQSEPWLRGTLTEVPVVQRAVLHALELAQEDLIRWCGNLTDAQLNSRPFDLPSLAFHLRHIARSIDRLLTYAEGRALDREQLSSLQAEFYPDATREHLFQEIHAALENAARRIRAFSLESLEQPRSVGRKLLPTNVGGLLVHVAEHTLRHVGQAITTSKILTARNQQSEILD